jgi:Mg2+ and Co2+ transporter CorA
MEAKKGNIESSIDAMSKEYASNAEQAESTKQDIENSVATNQTASEASKTMEAIEKEAATLKNRLKNLREEANNAFK